MQFDSLNDFLAMGGYAFFVWSAYGITAVVLALNVVLPIAHHARLKKNLARERRLQASAPTQR